MIRAAPGNSGAFALFAVVLRLNSASFSIVVPCGGEGVCTVHLAAGLSYRA